MKNRIVKNTVITAILFLSTLSIFAQNDFRNATWGMDAASVKNTETTKIISEDQFKVVYDCLLADIKGNIIYTFTTKGQLMRSKYLLTPHYFSMNNYIKDYKLFEELLTAKYGDVVKKSVVNTSNKSNITENDWSALLVSGQLRIENIWSTPKTTILLTLSKTGDKPTIQIDYISKEFNDKDMRERKAIILKNI
ncbi:MAG: hypothetical protein WBN17_06885 [Aureibaculum sp.]|jgi:hypothetical protein